MPHEALLLLFFHGIVFISILFVSKKCAEKAMPRFKNSLQRIVLVAAETRTRIMIFSGSYGEI
jgi:hypothetical protein